MKANKSIQQKASKQGTQIKLHKIIYKLIDDLKDELSNRLPPTVKQNVIGAEPYFCPITKNAVFSDCINL